MPTSPVGGVTVGLSPGGRRPSACNLGPVDVSRDQRAAIAEVVTKLEREFYGRGPSAVRVSVSDSAPHTIAVLSMDTLTIANRTLLERGDLRSIKAHHQAVNEATTADFCAEIETIVGRWPTAYLAQVDPNTAIAVRVFVFDEPANTDA